MAVRSWNSSAPGVASCPPRSECRWSRRSGNALRDERVPEIDLIPSSTAPSEDGMPLAEMAITVITGRRTRSSSLTPPRSTGGALGGLLGLRFAPAADGQQQGRLTPIGFCLGGFSRSRAEALRRRRLLRQAAFQRCHQVNDCWGSGHFPGFVIRERARRSIRRRS